MQMYDNAWSLITYAYVAEIQYAVIYQKHVPYAQSFLKLALPRCKSGKPRQAEHEAFHLRLLWAYLKIHNSRQRFNFDMIYQTHK